MKVATANQNITINVFLPGKEGNVNMKRESVASHVVVIVMYCPSEAEPILKHR